MALVLWCLLVMGILGALFGIGLAIASRFFAVETDPRIEAVTGSLPGVNCGACGYAGCSGYAEAVVNQGAPVNLCIPGGMKVAQAVGDIMGVKAEARTPVRAVVHCQGGTDRCGQRMEYKGIEDCRAANLVQGGPKMCEFGCLGYGTCARACPYDAIAMGPDRIPVVDWDKCTGCGACVKACPRNIIEVLPATISHYVACCNQDKGKSVKDICKVGCISCWMCTRVSPEGSMVKNGNVPKLTYPEGVDYQAAMDKCPMHCFVKIEKAPGAQAEKAESGATGQA